MTRSTEASSSTENRAAELAKTHLEALLAKSSGRTLETASLLKNIVLNEEEKSILRQIDRSKNPYSRESEHMHFGDDQARMLQDIKRRCLNAIRATGGTNKEALNIFGLVCMRTGEKDSAVHAFRLLSLIDPKNYEYGTLLVETLYLSQLYSEAYTVSKQYPLSRKPTSIRLEGLVLRTLSVLKKRSEVKHLLDECTSSKTKLEILKFLKRLDGVNFNKDELLRYLKAHQSTINALLAESKSGDFTAVVKTIESRNLKMKERYYVYLCVIAGMDTQKGLALLSSATLLHSKEIFFPACMLALIPQENVGNPLYSVIRQNIESDAYLQEIAQMIHVLLAGLKGAPGLSGVFAEARGSRLRAGDTTPINKQTRNVARKI